MNAERKLDGLLNRNHSVFGRTCITATSPLKGIQAGRSGRLRDRKPMLSTASQHVNFTLNRGPGRIQERIRESWQIIRLSANKSGVESSAQRSRHAPLGKDDLREGFAGARSNLLLDELLIGKSRGLALISQRDGRAHDVVFGNP